MPDLARDTFTDVAYSVLSAHMEEVSGANWSGLPTSNRLLISPGGKAFRSAYNPPSGNIDQINGSDAFLSFAPPSGDYKAQLLVTWLGPYLAPCTGGVGAPADFPDDGAAPGRILGIKSFCIPEPEVPAPPNGGATLVNGQWINLSGINNNPAAGSNHRVYLYARIQGAQTSCYTFGYETTGSRYVLCKDQTDIGVDGPTFVGWFATVAAPAWTPGESRLFEIRVNGTAIDAYVDGVNVLSAVHVDYATGKGGFEIKGGSSPVRGFHVDDFKIQSLAAPPPPTTLFETLTYRGSEGIEQVKDGS